MTALQIHVIINYINRKWRNKLNIYEKMNDIIPILEQKKNIVFFGDNFEEGIHRIKINFLSIFLDKIK